MQVNRTAFAVCVCLSALVFGVGGLIVGYKWGHLDSDGQNAPEQSALFAGVLRLHRNGELDQALSLLERSLDTSLMQRGIYDLRPHPLANLVVDDDAEVWRLQFAADYRAEFPRLKTVSWAQEPLDVVVARYKSGGTVPPNKSLERTRER